MPQLSLHSPVGDLTISSDTGAIVALDWGWVSDQGSEPLLIQARDHLNAYFDGATSPFDLPLRPSGSAFQLRVWSYMCDISLGTTMTYGDISHALKSSPRAIGLACGRNPIPIIIPCHRVVSAGGALGGYSGDGGAATKEALLRIEGVAGFGPDLFDHN